MTSRPDYSDSSGRIHLPVDYTEVPWEKRPLAMRIFERQLGQPMEEIISLLWYKYRRLAKISRSLGLENSTVRRWMKSLNLYICMSCSVDNGRLHNYSIMCEECNLHFCKDCIQHEIKYHTPIAKRDFKEIGRQAQEGKFSEIP